MGSSRGESPKEGWRKEQKGQHWGVISPTGRKGLTPTWVFKQVDQASFFKKLFIYSFFFFFGKRLMCFWFLVMFSWSKIKTKFER